MTTLLTTQLVPAFATEPLGSETLSVRFSPDDSWLAAACASGQVSIFNCATAKEAYRLNISGGHPMKQVCWRPEREDASLRTRGVLVGASTDGKMRQWHVTSSQLLAEWGDPERHSQLYCVDYSPDGSQMVVGGTAELFVYDEETKQEVVNLKGGDGFATGGHTSRVYAARFMPVPEERYGVISGGWDNNVVYWDLRSGHAVKAFFGPEITGDSLDISTDGKRILTGSWREKDPLEMWDLASGERLESIPWRSRGNVPVGPCFLYACRFSKDPASSLIAAGGSSAGISSERGDSPGEAKVFERGASGRAAGRSLGTVVNFTCLSADFGTPESGLVALGGSDGRVRALRLEMDEEGSRRESIIPALDFKRRPTLEDLDESRG